MSALDSTPNVPAITDAILLGDPAKSQPALGMRAILARWWVAFSLSSVCVVSGHLMIKAGLNTLTVAGTAHSGVLARVAHLMMQPEVVGGLLIYSFGTVCWMIAVSQKDISFLYPLSSVNYVLVVAASAVLFAEVISTRRALGVALIVLGMILLNRKSGEERS